MIKFNRTLLTGMVLWVTATGLLTSCDDDTINGCTAESYEGTWYGFYAVAGLLPLPNGDTLTVTVDGNTATITSSLAKSTFTGTYNETTGDVEISTFNAPTFAVGSDTLYDVTVQSGTGKIRNDCSTLFINLDKLSIQSGTIDLSLINPNGDEKGYPINNINIATQTNEPFTMVP